MALKNINISVPLERDKLKFFFSLMKKEPKKSRLPNLCSFHLGKSFERNPSRGNGSGLRRFSATLLRIADVHLLTKEAQKDLPGSNPNIQRPDLPGGSAVPLKMLPYHKERWGVRKIRKSVAVTNIKHCQAYSESGFTRVRRILGTSTVQVKISAIDFMMCDGFAPKAPVR